MDEEKQEMRRAFSLEIVENSIRLQAGEHEKMRMTSCEKH